MTIGDRVKQSRERQNLSQIQLAVRAGVSQSAISRLESGNTKSVDQTTIQALAVVLGAEILEASPGTAHGTGGGQFRVGFCESVFSAPLVTMSASGHVLAASRETDAVPVWLARAGVTAEEAKASAQATSTPFSERGLIKALLIDRHFDAIVLPNLGSPADIGLRRCARVAAHQGCDLFYLSRVQPGSAQAELSADAPSLSEIIERSASPLLWLQVDGQSSVISRELGMFSSRVSDALKPREVAWTGLMSELSPHSAILVATYEPWSSWFRRRLSDWSEGRGLRLQRVTKSPRDYAAGRLPLITHDVFVPAYPGSGSQPGWARIMQFVAALGAITNQLRSELHGPVPRSQAMAAISRYFQIDADGLIAALAPVYPGFDAMLYHDIIERLPMT